jgi:hypothetical protein
MRRRQIETPSPERRTPPVAGKREQPATDICSNCNSVVERRYAFCWHCGKPMKGDSSALRSEDEPRPARRLVIDMDDASTVEPRGDSIFSPEVPRDRKKVNRGGSNSGLKLMIMLLVVGAALISAMAGVMWLRRPALASVSAASASLVSEGATANLQSDRVSLPTVAATDSPADQPLQTRNNARAAEDELRLLRQKTIPAKPAEQALMARDFVRLEKQYANDYRFSYERAKFIVRQPRLKSYDAAFQALFLAAEKAIKWGKANEMLQSMQADKRDDLQKLARGHSEWGQVVQALKNRDVKLLNLNARLAQAF